MIDMYKICVVTGTRAEYGLLKPVIQKIQEDESLELQLVVTGMHLSTEFGLTYQEIENDGYHISRKVDMLVSSDTSAAIVKSMGLEMIGMADAFEELKPDMLVVLGDRYEALVAASTAMIYRVPIVHIHGGEATEGLIDEAIRHSITKMSALHFAATEEYARRIVQLGENPSKVHNVGALGVENIKNVNLLDKEELVESIGFDIDKDTALVTFHPVTLENQSAESQFRDLLLALEETRLKIIFTKANSDTDGRIINRMIDEFVREHETISKAFDSLGQKRYLSALRCVKMVIGNSSSGIIEVPSFGIATIDIGDRQKGRIRADSVVHCEPEKKSIIDAINYAQTVEFEEICRNVYNPYEGCDTTKTIIECIKKELEEGISIKKKFYDI